MSEPKVNERKVVGRNIAIALAIICIVLVAGLAEIIIVLNGANSQITNLKTQLDDLNNIANLNKSETIANTTVILTPLDNYARGFDLLYSDFIWVNVQSNTTDYSVSVYWSSDLYPSGFSFQKAEKRTYQEYIKNQYFPVVAIQYPTQPFQSAATVMVQNNSTELMMANVTITYYY